MLRISPSDSKKIEYSTNQGRLWVTRFPGSPQRRKLCGPYGFGAEILGTTDKGLFYSPNDGHTLGAAPLA